MGFLQDMRNLEQQADGTVAPARAPDLALPDPAGTAAIRPVRCADVVADEPPALEPDPADPSSVTLD